MFHISLKLYRLLGKARFTDSSKLKVGKQSIVNRLTFMNMIDFPWYDINISDDILRRNLKQNFNVHTPNLT